MGGNFAPEQVAGIFRNEWQVWAGIRTFANFQWQIFFVLGKLVQYKIYRETGKRRLSKTLYDIGQKIKAGRPARFFNETFCLTPYLIGHIFAI